MCIFVLIHRHEHFKIDAFSMITLSVLFSVDRRHKCIKMRTGPKFQTPLFHFLRGKPCPCQHFTIAFVLSSWLSQFQPIFVSFARVTILFALCCRFKAASLTRFHPNGAYNQRIILVETLRPKGAFWRFTDFQRGKIKLFLPHPLHAML